MKTRRCGGAAGGDRGRPLDARQLSGALYNALVKIVALAAVLTIAFRLATPLTAVLLLFLLASILAAVITPAASFLEARGIPRFVTALGLVLLIAGGLGLLAWFTVPRVVRDVYGFASRLNLEQLRVAGRLENLWQAYPMLGELLPPPRDLLRDLFPPPYTVLNWMTRAVRGMFALLLSGIILVVLVVHAVGHPTPLVAGWLAAIPSGARVRVEAILRRSMDQLRYWALGTFYLSLLVGTLTGLGLWAIGRFTGHPFPYILLFSVIAAIGEVIPILGPILSAIPPMLIALTIDPAVAGWVALLFLLIQQVENNVIVPLVMSKSVDLHPFSLIFVLMVMQALFGILGAFLATPVAILIKICWEECYLKEATVDPRQMEREARQLIRDSSH